MNWHKFKAKFQLDDVSFCSLNAYPGPGIVLVHSGQGPNERHMVHAKGVDEGCLVKGLFWETNKEVAWPAAALPLVGLKEVGF